METKEILKHLKDLQKHIQRNKFTQDEIKYSYDGECEGGVFIRCKGVESRVNKLINELSK